MVKVFMILMMVLSMMNKKMSMSRRTNKKMKRRRRSMKIGGLYTQQLMHPPILHQQMTARARTFTTENCSL